MDKTKALLYKRPEIITLTFYFSCFLIKNVYGSMNFNIWEQLILQK